MNASYKILGAAQTVTGSKHLLSYDGFNLLIDCGLYQGNERIRADEKDSLGFPAKDIDAVILTHAHLDHCGFIPKLVLDGFKGPIFCTSVTRDITRIILMDSAKIQIEEIRNAKKKNLSKHQVGEPLYYSHDVKFSMGLFRALEYKDPLKIGPFEILLHQAGHVPGAASAGVRWDSGSMLFSGDLGRYNDLMTFDPHVSEAYENIVLESTYGDRVHGDLSQFEILKDVIQKNKDKNGTLLIPAFSLSRSQLLLLQIKEVFNAYPELEIPVYLDSPMANEVTEVIVANTSSIKQEINEITDAFKGFHFVREPWEAKSLIEKTASRIIVTASGMLSGGRVLSHLENLGEDDKNTIFIPGYQSPGTLGFEITHDNVEVTINNKEIKLKAEIIHSGVFSAHADSKELIRWLKELPDMPKRVFLVHGQIAAMDSLMHDVAGLDKQVEVLTPLLNTSFEL